MQGIIKHKQKQLDLFPSLDRKHKLYLLKENFKESFLKSFKPTFYIGLIIPSIVFWLIVVYTNFSFFNTIKFLSIFGELFAKAETARQIALTNGLFVVYLYMMLFTFVVIFTSIFIPSALNPILSPKEEIITPGVFDFSAEEEEIKTKYKNQR